MVRLTYNPRPQLVSWTRHAGSGELLTTPESVWGGIRTTNLPLLLMPTTRRLLVMARSSTRSHLFFSENNKVHVISMGC